MEQAVSYSDAALFISSFGPECNTQFFFLLSSLILCVNDGRRRWERETRKREAGRYPSFFSGSPSLLLPDVVCCCQLVALGDVDNKARDSGTRRIREVPITCEQTKERERRKREHEKTIGSGGWVILGGIVFLFLCTSRGCPELGTCQPFAAAPPVIAILVGGSPRNNWWPGLVWPCTHSLYFLPSHGAGSSVSHLYRVARPSLSLEKRSSRHMSAKRSCLVVY